MGWSNINGGHFFGLQWLPGTFTGYVNPTISMCMSVVPVIWRPGADRQFRCRRDTSTIDCHASTVPGGTLGRRHRRSAGSEKPSYRAMRILLVSAAMTMVPHGLRMDLRTFIRRFHAVVGLGQPWSAWWTLWVGPARRRSYVQKGIPIAALVLALLGFWVNMSYAGQPTAALEHGSGSSLRERGASLGKVTAAPPVLRASASGFSASPAPKDALVVWGDCKALSVETGAQPRGELVDLLTVLVEQAPHTPICDELVHRG